MKIFFPFDLFACYILSNIHWYFRTKTPVYKFDHVYPGTANKDVVAALYGELGKPGFSELHEKLKSLSKQKTVTYVLRHFVKVTGCCMNCYPFRELQKKIVLTFSVFRQWQSHAIWRFQREREREPYINSYCSVIINTCTCISLIGSLDSLFPFYVHCTCKTCTSKNIMIMFKNFQ